MTRSPGVLGADVEQLEALGRLLQAKADEIRAVVGSIDGRLPYAPWVGRRAAAFREQVWPAHQRELWRIADNLEGLGQSALNNAAEQRAASAAAGGGRATAGGVGAAALRLLPSGWASMTTAQRARRLMRIGWSDGDQVWLQLDKQQRSELVAYLREEGELGLLPPEVRYAVNRARVYDEYMRLNALPSPSAREGQQLDLYARLLREDERYRVLVFDPSGDGRMVVVQGDLANAPNVVVQVPGMSNDMSSFGGIMADGARLYGAAGPTDTAVVTWLGYDTPEGVVQRTPQRDRDLYDRAGGGGSSAAQSIRVRDRGVPAGGTDLGHRS